MWFSRFRKSNLTNEKGTQRSEPVFNLTSEEIQVTSDAALQISAVWRAVEILAKIISTLPLNVYEDGPDDTRTIAKETDLYRLFHNSPNSLMTSSEFLSTMMLNFLLRGNAYARIDRKPNGECFALTPMAADQVEFKVLDDGSRVYLYTVDNNLAILAEQNVLHIKEMGNGITGFSRLHYMASTITEATFAQRTAQKLFGKNGRPAGMLMIDSVLRPEARIQLQNQFAAMVAGSTDKLFVLEANMKFQPLNLTPQDMQLLSTRQFSAQEIGRWFGVPAILLNQTEGTSTLGSSAQDIIEAFYKLTVRPLIVNIEQSLKKRVLTPSQRVKYTVEFNMDALLRASLKDRMEIYAKGTQNGIMTRNQCRGYENWEKIDGADVLTVMSNLVPIDMLGKTPQVNAPNSISEPTTTPVSQ